jgi:hypothetical protein
MQELLSAINFLTAASSLEVRLNERHDERVNTK